MLEGLEIVELSSRDFRFDNIDYRLDSEYFIKSNLSLLNQLEKIGIKKIGDFCYVTDGIHTSIDYCDKSNVNLISATSPRENYFDISRQVFISEEAHRNNPRTALIEDDIIISTVGTIGNCAVVTESILPANSDRHVGIIRIKEDFFPNYVSTFLLSKYGRFQTFRESTGNVQLNLFLYKIRTLKIANLSLDFQGKIDLIVKQAHNNIRQSQFTYCDAEALLLSELGLTDFEPSKEAVSVKSLKESFLSSGRLDAEYYQGKYDEYENLVFSYSNGYTTVSNEFALNKDTFDSKKRGYNYIEIGDVNVTDGSFGSNFVESEDLPANAKIKVKQNDLLISKVRPYRGAVSIINTNDEDLIASGAFTVLRESGSINKESLFVLLRTPIYKDWLLKWNVGTSYPVIKDEDVLNLFIPKLPQSIQQQIASKIQESFSLKAQSNQLLEVAKRAVEIAIEEGEENATKYIQQKIIEISNPKLIIQISIPKELSELDFSEENNNLLSCDILPLVTVRESNTYACLEWAIPTAIAVIIGQFSSGFFGEMGKDAYSALKIGLKKLARKGRLINLTLVGTKPVDANNKQSKSFSIESKTKQGIPVKFLFENDAAIEEWESWIDKATALLEENFCQDNSEMLQKIDSLEQPISSPLFWTYDRGIEEWMPYDMKKEQRIRYEEHIKKEKGDLQ